MISANDIKLNWQEITANVKKVAKQFDRNFNDIKIIAVSKTQPIEVLIAALGSGIKVFGENYAQEIKSKYDDLKKRNIPIPEFHYIGGLQRTNVKTIAPFVSTIHSVDSFRLAEEIDKRAEENNRIIKCLLQVNTSGELSKSGCKADELLQLVEEVLVLKNISISGLMSIGSFTENESIQKKEFILLRELLELVNTKFDLNWKDLSMGMTNDYFTAIEEGSTMIRIGTALFGSRTGKKLSEDFNE